MVAQAKKEFFKLKASLWVTILPEPQWVTEALVVPEWKGPMQNEYDALMKNGTWELIPKSRNGKSIGHK